MTVNVDILIHGGGLAGLACAAALRDSPWKVGLIEPQPQRGHEGQWDARVYAYTPAAVALLERLDVWPRLDPERWCAVDRMEVFGDAGGMLSFSAYEAGLSRLAVIAEQSLVRDALWEAVRRQRNLTLLTGEGKAGQALVSEEGTLTVVCRDGSRVRTRLLVGADGRQSWVRMQAGLPARVVPYHQQGIVANFAVQRPHRHVARQWFRDDGVLAFLPLPGERVSIVWSAPQPQAEALLALDEAAFARRVEAASGGILGAMTTITPRQAFPLSLLRCPQVVRPRVALIGDAAHGIHPLSGHGINLGFNDVAVLGEVLRALPPEADPGALPVLSRYARRRAEEPCLMQTATDALARLFALQPVPLRQLRNVGMRLVDRLPFVKEALVRYAAFGDFFVQENE